MQYLNKSSEFVMLNRTQYNVQVKTYKENATELQEKSRAERYFLLTLKVSLLLLSIAIVIVVFILSLFYHTYIYHFKLAAHLTDAQIHTVIADGLKAQIVQTDGHKNILLLGTDELANRKGDPVLTDSMMVFSLDTHSGVLQAVSLPRDLWSPEYKTKINSLYEYGKERYPGSPQRFPTEVVQDLTQVTIHNTVVLSLDQLQQLIDIMGGVSIDIPESFVDEQFPRTDVDIKTEHDPKKLYQRVEFTQGVERMSGERALQFVRSRHSSQADQGNDDARTIRQQLVINALLTQLRDPQIVKNPEMLGTLYHWYETNFSSSLSIPELIQIGKTLGTKAVHISLKPQALSIQSDEKDGVIMHPPISKYNQWVYEIKSLEQFRAEVKQKLQLNTDSQ